LSPGGGGFPGLLRCYSTKSYPHNLSRASITASDILVSQWKSRLTLQASQTGRFDSESLQHSCRLMIGDETLVQDDMPPLNEDEGTSQTQTNLRKEEGSKPCGAGKRREGSRLCLEKGDVRPDGYNGFKRSGRKRWVINAERTNQSRGDYNTS
jgi:hypothetical protein